MILRNIISSCLSNFRDLRHSSNNFSIVLSQLNLWYRVTRFANFEGARDSYLRCVVVICMNLAPIQKNPKSLRFLRNAQRETTSRDLYEPRSHSEKPKNHFGACETRSAKQQVRLLCSQFDYIDSHLEAI